MNRLSNILALLGAIALVLGMGMLKPAAGVITLGVMLILGAVATMRADVKQAKADAIKKAMNL